MIVVQALLPIDEVQRTVRFGPLVDDEGPDEVVLGIGLNGVVPELLDVFTIPRVGSLETRNLVEARFEEAFHCGIGGLDVHGPHLQAFGR